MTSEVLIQFEIEGFHNYPNAPKKVDFLENRHRHTFNVRAGYLVNDLNREKEIFIEREYIKEFLNETYGVPCEFENMSCEMIAKEILTYAQPEQMIWCEVWEENTGGAKISL